ncbi:ferredoxin [Aeromicrobium sp. Root495]|uniref:ferredoxin n=1 Tax=Aeromicrobium sp. Root495 TaxID=1736550 RepID=UPI0006F7DEDB|nr:ferredoxin [Aeromicrobium sp. Root495]KQY59864.1 ferredoxin [Aeromicrobium sp. Root495]
MRIDIDEARCEGHGLCEEAAPEVFSLDDDAMVVDAFGGGEVPDGLAAAARAAIASCPVAALRERT